MLRLQVIPVLTTSGRHRGPNKLHRFMGGADEGSTIRLLGEHRDVIWKGYSQVD